MEHILPSTLCRFAPSGLSLCPRASFVSQKSQIKGNTNHKIYSNIQTYTQKCPPRVLQNKTMIKQWYSNSIAFPSLYIIAECLVTCLGLVTFIYRSRDTAFIHVSMKRSYQSSGFISCVSFIRCNIRIYLFQLKFVTEVIVKLISYKSFTFYLKKK